MHRLFAWICSVPTAVLGMLLRRPRRVLIVLGIGALVLAVSSPFLWASYHWYAGQSALQRYRNAEARDHLNACLKIWPWSRSVRVHLLAARAARRKGDVPEAFQRLEEVQSFLGDQSEDALLEWAMVHAASGDLEKVEGYLRNRAGNDPQRLPLILEAFTEGYLVVSRINEALQCVNEWLRRDPDNVGALYLRSAIFRQINAWAKAAPDLRRIMELDPEHPGVRWWLAIALVNVGYYQEALGHLEILRQRQPDDVDIRVQEAICKHRLGRTREARELLDSVLAQYPDHGLALLTRGQIDQMNGQLSAAEKWLRQAVHALPFDYKAHWMLRECLRQQGKNEEAETVEAYANQLRDRLARLSEITTRQISKRPNDPALYCEAAQLALELGNAEGSKKWLLNALLLDPHYVPALMALADLYEKQGDAASAEEYRRQAQLH